MYVTLWPEKALETRRPIMVWEIVIIVQEIVNVFWEFVRIVWKILIIIEALKCIYF